MALIRSSVQRNPRLLGVSKTNPMSRQLQTFLEGSDGRARSAPRDPSSVSSARKMCQGALPAAGNRFSIQHLCSSGREARVVVALGAADPKEREGKGRRKRIHSLTLPKADSYELSAAVNERKRQGC